jgi:uncharacterized membrane-anchored protein
VSARSASLVLAAVHVALLGLVGARYAADRARHPRVWARVTPIDPDLPIRGRYVALGVEVHADPALRSDDPAWATLAVEGDRLVARPAADATGERIVWPRGDGEARLVEPLAFFIPEDAPDPSRRDDGREVWVEVSVPPAGPPRPIRLGVKERDRIVPLDLD